MANKEEMKRMPPTASTSNLNAKLSSTRDDERSSDVGISWAATPIHSSAPPVRIVGAARPYRGGYRINL